MLLCLKTPPPSTKKMFLTSTTIALFSCVLTVRLRVVLRQNNSSLRRSIKVTGLLLEVLNLSIGVKSHLKSGLGRGGVLDPQTLLALMLLVKNLEQHQMLSSSIMITLQVLELIYKSSVSSGL